MDGRIKRQRPGLLTRRHQRADHKFFNFPGDDGISNLRSSGVFWVTLASSSAATRLQLLALFFTRIWASLSQPVVAALLVAFTLVAARQP